MDKDPELGIPSSTLQTSELDSTHQEGSGRSPKGRAQPRRGERSKGTLEERQPLCSFSKTERETEQWEEEGPLVLSQVCASAGRRRVRRGCVGQVSAAARLERVSGSSTSFTCAGREGACMRACVRARACARPTLLQSGVLHRLASALLNE